jgi:hypothetical protein
LSTTAPYGGSNPAKTRESTTWSDSSAFNARAHTANMTKPAIQEVEHGVSLMSELPFLKRANNFWAVLSAIESAQYFGLPMELWSLDSTRKAVGNINFSQLDTP